MKPLSSVLVHNLEIMVPFYDFVVKLNRLSSDECAVVEMKGSVTMD